MPQHFNPCSATDNSFLSAQGSSNVCRFHSSLSTCGRFTGHEAKVELLAVDHLGHYAVSCDMEGLAIIWNLVYQFRVDEPLTGLA